MPFVATKDSDPRKGPVTFSYQVNVDERLRRVSYTLIPAEGRTLPTQHDQPILMALWQLWLSQPSPERGFDFRRREVFDLLEWSNAGHYHDRLRSALYRITQMTIEIRSELVSRTGTPYGRLEGAAHIIDRFWLHSQNGTGRVEWGGLVLEALELGDFKRLDWALMLSLADPIATQLYRVIDRATMAGQTEWEVPWRTLAIMLGMSPEAYDRPARFKSRVAPRFDELVERGIIAGWSYRRGGRFTVHLRNYLRSKLREVLCSLGVFEEAARQLIAGYDEVSIIRQCDCMQHGSRPRPSSPGGYLVQAVRENYELRYPDNEEEMFVGIWEFLSEPERNAYHQAGLKLCHRNQDLFDSNADPTAWTQELRSVVRFLICHSFDAEEVVGGGVSAPPLPGADE